MVYNHHTHAAYLLAPTHIFGESAIAEDLRKAVLGAPDYSKMFRSTHKPVLKALYILSLISTSITPKKTS